MNNKLTWHDVKIYGAGTLAGMAIYWGAMQYAKHKSMKKPNPTIEWKTQIQDEKRNEKTIGIKTEDVSEWNALKQNFEPGTELSMYDLEDSSIIIRATYIDRGAKTIELRKEESEQFVNTKKLDSIYQLAQEKKLKKEWIANYKEHLKNYKQTYKIQCDTLVRTKFGGTYNISDLNGDGEYDRILYIGRHPGDVMDLRLERNSAKFKQTLNRLIDGMIKK